MTARGRRTGTARYAALLVLALAVPARAQEEPCADAAVRSRIAAADAVWLGTAADAGGTGNTITLDVRVRETLRGDQDPGSIVRVLVAVPGARLSAFRRDTIVAGLTAGEQVVAARAGTGGTWEWPDAARCPTPAARYAGLARDALGLAPPDDGFPAGWAVAGGAATLLLAAAAVLGVRRRRAPG